MTESTVKGADDLRPGRLVRLSARVQRLVAPNASLMTGPGTNSYVLGDPAVAVLDPGPDDPAHLERLRQAAPGLRFVFVTHTHRDHACGARALADAAGAPIVGRPPPSDGLQDLSCVPSIEARHDSVFELNGRSGDAGAAGAASHAIHSPDLTRLRAIHTPGHASNHVCFLLEEEGLLFSGDHVLDGVTPVILPPDGDMAAYLHSLELLKRYEPRAIAPGHGRVLGEPLRVIDGIVAHRGRREAKVLAVLGAVGQGEIDVLLPKVYDDVRVELLPIARYSLEAHLIKLEREGRATRTREVWSPSAAAAHSAAGEHGERAADNAAADRRAGKE
jgi:glyoxylase-like metal-dependent hydrolase (beta-lactamase superfamily II)